MGKINFELSFYKTEKLLLESYKKNDDLIHVIDYYKNTLESIINMTQENEFTDFLQKRLKKCEELMNKIIGE